MSQSKTTTHSFEETTFSKPTFCKSCDKFIWGFVNQGVQCTDCGYIAHFDCQSNASVCIAALQAPKNKNSLPIKNTTTETDKITKVDTSINHSPRLSANGNSKSKSTSPKIQSTTTNPHILSTTTTSGNTIHPSSTTTTTSKSSSEVSLGMPPIITKPSFKSINKKFKKSCLQHHNTCKLVGGLANATLKAAMNLESDKKTGVPPLNLLTTTPKNFAKFIHRAGVVRAVHEEVMSVLMWENAGKTLMCIIAVIILTLYPYFLVITPQATLIYIIMQRYYEKARKQAHIEDPNKSDSGPISSQSMTGISSAEYAKNMQWIQNFMGQFVDAYDMVVEYSKVVDWSDEKKTSFVLKVTVASALTGLVIARFLPARFLFMTVSITPFLANTAFVRAVVTSMPALLVAKVMSYYNKGKELFVVNYVPTGDSAVVEIYQNERWWAGLGFIPHLLPSERKPWSDVTGLVEMPDIDSYTFPTQDWEWVEDSWIINGTWAEVDPEGWCYMDNRWEHPRKSPGILSFTRRRLWTHTMRRAKSGAVIKTPPCGTTVEVTPRSTLTRSSSSSSRKSDDGKDIITDSSIKEGGKSLGLLDIKAEE